MIKMMENKGVYIIELRPETGLEQTLLREIDKAVKGMSEYEYWDVKPKKEKEFMDQGFVYDKENINPFTEGEERPEPVREDKEDSSGDYVQEEIEWQ